MDKIGDLPFPHCQKESKFRQFYQVALTGLNVYMQSLLCIWQISIIFPEAFKPKLYFLWDYHQLIIANGSPWSHWCMRLETKHRYFKIVATITNNYVNLSDISAGSGEFENHHKQSVSDYPFTMFWWLAGLFAELEERKSGRVNVLSWTLIKLAIRDFFVVDLVHAEQRPLFVKITLCKFG